MEHEEKRGCVARAFQRVETNRPHVSHALESACHFATLLRVAGLWASLAAPLLAANASDLDPAFELVARSVADGEIPGAAALVVHQGKVLREAAYGVSDLERQTVFRTDTICWIASMTKAITATAIMLLVEDGKLRLDEPVEKYLPEFAGRTNFNGRHHPFTVRQLLLYTSGLAEQSANPKRRRPHWGRPHGCLAVTEIRGHHRGNRQRPIAV